MELKELLKEVADGGIEKLVASKGIKNGNFKKISITKLDKGYLAEKFTEKQAFSETLSGSTLMDFLINIASEFMQFNIWSNGFEHIILVSKKGKVSYKKNKSEKTLTVREHNRKKQYLIEEGTVIAPLVDMGIFTKEGKVVRQMQDKFRQINRFIELIHDEIKNKSYKEINIIDFGCGKSYLTFIVYYYLTEIMNIKANITGLDLKKDVIENCNRAAKRYGYNGLHFEVGDINGYKCEKKPDMVITLHACDTATDYALFNAISWDADLIFSVPCCQHELNAQMQSEKFSILTRYGIVKERVCALMTDAIRANLLRYMGYNTQLLEFVDMSHTPKNVLIRASKTQISKSQRDKYKREADALISEFGFDQTLYRLLIKE